MAIEQHRQRPEAPRGDGLVVAHVTPTLARRTGGPAVLIVELARALEREGVRSVVYSTDMGRAPAAWSSERLGEDDLPDGAGEIDLRLFPMQRPYRLAFSRPLAHGLATGEPSPDVVHIHSLFLHPQYAAFRHARRTGTPYVVSPHGSLDPFLRRRGRIRKAVNDVLWQRRMLAGADALHVTTDDERDLVADVAPGVRRAVVPLGIHWDRFQAEGDAGRFRAAHLAGHEGPIVLFLGRLSFKKGIDILIDSFARVSARHRDALLVIAGPDDEDLEPELWRRAEAAGISRSVVFTGLLQGEDRLDALSAAAVWALSSHTENFGVAVIEALASGLPVVISPAVNVAPDIRTAGAGVVAELDARSFADAIAGLLDDEARAADLSRRAREFARGYDWAAVAPRFARMYRELADQA